MEDPGPDSSGLWDPSGSAESTVPPESGNTSDVAEDCRSPKRTPSSEVPTDVLDTPGAGAETPVVPLLETGGGEDKQRKRRRSAESRASRCSVNSTKLKSLKLLVDKAVEHHKTFTILGKFPSIRDALRARGWVQNFDALSQQRSPAPYSYRPGVGKDEEGSGPPMTPTSEESVDRDSQLISRLLRDSPVNFIWAMGDYIDWKYLSKSTIVSRFPRVYFTTKVGLCNYLQQTHWFCEAGVSNTLFPRCYNIANEDDLNAFIMDFRLTACLSLLHLLVDAIDRDQLDIFHEDGKVPLCAVEFAARRCTEFVGVREHEDIDVKEAEHVWDHQWDQFLTWYYQLAHEHANFLPATDTQRKAIYICCKMTIESMRPHWPQMQLDGTSNLWIVKPGAKSRGRGIQVMRKLEDIVSRIGTLHSKDPRYVIQKYIERPLLIYNTKFDIRQWFLVTSAYPLTIWMYKESYLRFCSQLFSLSNMHESVHLSNNAVQCKYKNAKRDQALPDENMWDCYTFQTYLRTIGQADLWETVIYPGMRESITGTLLAAQEHMEHRKNCFELYGADFMLTDDMVPWLIEINSSPCMSPTTSVTARMCSQCLEDVIKVVIDRRHNKQADTGMFEMVYKQHISPPQPYMGMNLTVRGTKIQRSPKTKRKRKPSLDTDLQLSIKCTNSIKSFIQDLSSKLTEQPEVTQLTVPLDSSKSALPTSPSSYSLSSSDDDSTDSENSFEVKISDKPVTVQDISTQTVDMASDKEVQKTKQDTESSKSGSKPKVTKESQEDKSSVESKEAKKKSHHATCCKPVENLAPKLFRAGTRYNKSNHLRLWKRSTEAAQTNVLLNDWKQRIDKTRANCEEMLTKLKVLRDKDVNNRVKRGINWKVENGTVEEIVKKLAHPQKKEFLERLPIVRDSVQRKSLCDKDSQGVSKSRSSSTSPFASRHVLPQIKDRTRSFSTIENNNLFAVGLSLQCQKSNYTPREKLLMPMGSEHCLGMSLGSLSNALASS
ncbi:tubulin monoglycylase TTLL3-like [Homalodisca vitripennis]|uniref:tubulin monoglycylase TTLL3-like n=1 Tax=Homalodisca vitripennis TaxID=197043 RepID=UPI001EEC9C2A|nr:tubulin monoglycylase TTLL3-like [Homalodisca vitripennis]